MSGPTVPACQQLHADKYRMKGESFYEAMRRVAAATADGEEHYQAMKKILLDMRFMPGGRIQSTVGSARKSTPFNCFVSGDIKDSMVDIMDKAKEAALTMQKGGGIGYDFSLLRPNGAPIVSIDSSASGPISFMEVFDAVCRTIMAAGHRRGAMMGVLRVDHPDIEEFIRVKQNNNTLTNFNISIGITDKFMVALKNELPFNLEFEGKVYKTVEAKALWDSIMRGTWDWAEPGVLFIDTINKMNNLYYCETIEATNPCGEQPLPPYGACLLGSFNLARYVKMMDVTEDSFGNIAEFDFEQFKKDIPPVIRAVDNVIDIADFPLEQQATEAADKRRMGIGITGLADVLAVLGYKYGEHDAVVFTKKVLRTLRDTAYKASVALAKEKGPFPLFNSEAYCNGEFIQTLPKTTQEEIKEHGIRNSHLLSIAPTGTISFCADNVSSGIEPIFATKVERAVQTAEGPKIVELADYAYSNWGVKGETTDAIDVSNHLNMLLSCVPYIDSAISKTVNVGGDVTFDQFKDIYVRAYDGGAKGCTTFRLEGKRFGMMKGIEDGDDSSTEEESSGACYIDPSTGAKSCDL